MAARSLTLEDIGRIQPGDKSACRIHQAITKSDSTSYDPPLRVVYVGGAGDIVLRDADGTSATYTCIAGTKIDWLVVTKVMSTGTTATNIVGAY